MRGPLVPALRAPLLLAASLCPVLALRAATGPGATNDEALKLRPPRGEIPPSFWDEQGTLVIVLGIAAVFAMALLIWYLARPRKIVPLPPEVRARNEFKALLGKPIDRNILSGASRILKRYFAEAFGLSLEEMTTAEFCRALKAKTEVEAGLAESVCGFLRKADGLKFAPGPTPEGCVTEAIELVELAEAKRIKIAQARTVPDSPAIQERSKA